MDFSVLMSVYQNDKADFFKAALTSVTVSQTLKPSQIVIVEDGPVPAGIDAAIEEVKQACPEVEFEVVSYEANKGLAAALNIGLSKCKYQFVARMDADDISVADRFEKQVAFLDRNKNVSVVGGWIAEFVSDPAIISSTREVYCDAKDIGEMAKTRTPMNHVTVMYDKNAVLSAGGYDEDFGRLEDYKLWVDLILSGYELANLKDVFVKVRTGEGFIDRRSNKREITDWDKLQDYLYAKKYISKYKKWINRLYIRGFIYMPVWLKRLAYKLFLRK